MTQLLPMMLRLLVQELRMQVALRAQPPALYWRALRVLEACMPEARLLVPALLRTMRQCRQQHNSGRCVHCTDVAAKCSIVQVL